jgi:hypothetical protein
LTLPAKSPQKLNGMTCYTSGILNMSIPEMTDDISWSTAEGIDWMIESGYEEIYNGEGRTAGELRFYKSNSGRFYQTHGNGGYWVRDDKTVWKVEGDIFTHLPGKTLSLVGVPYFPCSIHWWCKVD